MKKPLKVRKPIRPMRLLLHVHSLLSVHGQMDAIQISEKLQIRGVFFDIIMLHKMLHSEAAGYFGIRHISGTKDFTAIQFKLPEPSQRFVAKTEVKVQAAAIPSADYEAKKNAVMDFCVTHGRIPSANKGKEEAALYTFMNKHRDDRGFYAFVEKYKKRKGRPRNNKVAFQLADSGGVGF